MTILPSFILKTPQDSRSCTEVKVPTICYNFLFWQYFSDTKKEKMFTCQINTSVIHIPMPVTFTYCLLAVFPNYFWKDTNLTGLCFPDPSSST